jgi:hypothetical protein
MKPISRRALSAALVYLFAFAAPSFAQPQTKYSELLRRVPEVSNVIMLVDVDGLLDSPFGKQEGWREQAKDISRAGLGLLDDVSKLAVATQLDLRDLDMDWKVGMATMRGALPDLESLAKHNGGFVEQIATQKAAWTPRGFYFLTFPPQILAFVEPDDRQLLAGWIEKTFTRPRTSAPAFADRAVYRAERGAQVVVALDLEHAVSVPLIGNWIKGIESLANRKLDSEVAASQLGSAKSIFIEVKAAEDLTGTIRVEFARPIDVIRPVLKDLLLAALEDTGALLPEVASWSIAAEGDHAEFTGRLSVESLRRILSIVPAPNRTVQHQSLADDTPPPTENAQPAAKAPPSVAQATLGYFRSVCSLLDGLRQEKSNGYKGMQMWLDRYAKRIDELPVLGVDTAMLDWGNTISRTLREMALGTSYTSKNQAYAVGATGSGGYYAGYGYGYYGTSKATEAAGLKRRSNAQLGLYSDEVWAKIDLSRADLRRTMSEKYQVEF